jgi:hypothetical protein
VRDSSDRWIRWTTTGCVGLLALIAERPRTCIWSAGLGGGADSVLVDGMIVAAAHRQIRSTSGAQSDPIGAPEQMSVEAVVPPRSAGRRTFSLTFSITQRDALSGFSRSGATGLDVVVGKVPVAAASDRCGRGGEISPDHERAPRGR